MGYYGTWSFLALTATWKLRPVYNSGGVSDNRWDGSGDDTSLSVTI